MITLEDLVPGTVLKTKGMPPRITYTVSSVEYKDGNPYRVHYSDKRYGDWDYYTTVISTRVLVSTPIQRKTTISSKYRF